MIINVGTHTERYTAIEVIILKIP